MRKTVAVQQYYISIHALREEGDRLQHAYCKNHKNFYPRPPRGGRQIDNAFLGISDEISIHALREEGDRRCTVGQFPPGVISIHALREEGDAKLVQCQ